MKFEYHKQSSAYIRSILDASKIDPIDLRTIDLNEPNTSSISKNKWTGGDLNPRPPECKSGIHTN